MRCCRRIEKNSELALLWILKKKRGTRRSKDNFEKIYRTVEAYLLKSGIDFTKTLSQSILHFEREDLKLPKLRKEKRIYQQTEGTNSIIFERISIMLQLICHAWQ
ncbi:hypothetical protein TNCT_590561 [Trichonephila clavata]|uniref:Uncharacterized protein n=1 Tax=Trichonephila clavata TaxID=2740835 RepID=A0A8X6HNJ1_TRICU|nr:hypothetical protein TNCT_590561 [Trichonephila clavata]